MASSSSQFTQQIYYFAFAPHCAVAKAAVSTLPESIEAKQTGKLERTPRRKPALLASRPRFRQPTVQGGTVTCFVSGRFASIVGEALETLAASSSKFRTCF